MIKNLTFITGNANKAAQLTKYLGIPINHHKLDLEEIQSSDPDKITEHKVTQAYNLLKKPVLVDDVSFILNAIKPLPGPLIKWFEDGPKYFKLAKMMRVFKDKKATAIVNLGFFDGKELKIFKGVVNGTISDKPSGNTGFGWDVIFVPKGHSKTRAQMDEKDYDKTSPRRLALEKLEKYLNG